MSQSSTPPLFAFRILPTTLTKTEKGLSVHWPVLSKTGGNVDPRGVGDNPGDVNSYTDINTGETINLPQTTHRVISINGRDPVIAVPLDNTRSYHSYRLLGLALSAEDLETLETSGGAIESFLGKRLWRFRYDPEAESINGDRSIIKTLREYLWPGT